MVPAFSLVSTWFRCERRRQLEVLSHHFACRPVARSAADEHEEVQPSGKLWWQLSNSELNATTADKMLGVSLRSTVKAPRYRGPPMATNDQHDFPNATANWADGVMNTDASLGASMTSNQTIAISSSGGMTGYDNGRQAAPMANEVFGLVGAAVPKHKASTSIWGLNLRSGIVEPPPLPGVLPSSGGGHSDLLMMSAATTARGSAKIIQGGHPLRVNSGRNLKMSPYPEKLVNDSEERAMDLLRGLTTSGEDAVVRQSNGTLRRIHLRKEDFETEASLGGSNSATRTRTVRREPSHATTHDESPESVLNIPTVVTTNNEVNARRLSTSSVDPSTPYATAQRGLLSVRDLPAGKDEQGFSRERMMEEDRGGAGPRTSTQKQLSYQGGLVVDKGTVESKAGGTAEEPADCITPKLERRGRQELGKSLDTSSAGNGQARKPSADQAMPTESPHSGEKLKIRKKGKQQTEELNKPAAEKDPTENSKPKTKKDKRHQGKPNAQSDVVGKRGRKATAPKRNEADHGEQTIQEHDLMVSRPSSPASGSSSDTIPRSKATTSGGKKKRRSRSNSPTGKRKSDGTRDPGVIVAPQKANTIAREQEVQSEKTRTAGEETPPDPEEAESMLAVLAGLSLELKRRRRREQRRRVAAGGGEGGRGADTGGGDCGGGRIMYARVLADPKTEEGTVEDVDNDDKRDRDAGERCRLEERVSALEAAVTSSGVVPQNVAPTGRCVGCFGAEDD